MFRRSIILFVLLCLGVVASAQPTRVRGRVTDSEGNPLEFASVAFVGTTIGMVTDSEGIYSLETRDSVAVLQASMMGYIAQERPVKQGVFTQIDFVLPTADFAIEGVVVTPGENPAHPILDSLIRRKRQLDPDHLSSCHTRTYTKMELGLTNIKEEMDEIDF